MRSGREACSVLPVFLLVFSWLSCKPPETASVKVIVGAVLIDGTGGPPVSNSIVLISGPRIIATGPRTAFVIPQGAEQIDGSGKFIIPTLINTYIPTHGVTAMAGGGTLTAGVIASA